MSKLYMIDCTSTHHIRYVIETGDDVTILEKILCDVDENDHELKEFSQDFLGETVISASRIVSEDEYLLMFDEDNEYLKDWNKEKKLEIINRIYESK